MAFNTKILGNHYRTERFAIIFCSLMSVLILCIGMCAYQYIAALNKSIGETTLYSTEFAFSVSGTNGSIEDVYSNEDHTRAFVLMKFNDIAKISTNAEDYEVYITPYDTQGNDLTTPNFSVSWYMFATSGYAGLYFTDTSGIDSQILKVTIRNNNVLSEDGEATEDDTTAEDYGGDASFLEYDQAQFYVNVGGRDSNYIDVLNESNITAKTLYDATILPSLEQSAEDDLIADLDTMISQKKLMTEYTNRVTTDGVIIPTIPSIVDGDTVEKNDDDSYTVNFATNCKGAYLFDWQNGSISDGYSDAAMKAESISGQTLAQFIAKHNSDMNMSGSDSEFSLGNYSNASKWTLSNGIAVSELQNGSGSSSNNGSVYQDTSDDINGLISAWRSYYSAKKSYQTTHLGKLLSLEMTASNIYDKSTVNSDSDSVIIY